MAEGVVVGKEAEAEIRRQLLSTTSKDNATRPAKQFNRRTHQGIRIIFGCVANRQVVWDSLCYSIANIF